MKIAIIGATGRAGSRIAQEALRRGHAVVGIARTVDSAALPDGARPVPADASEPDALAAAITGCDAVVSSARFVSLLAGPVLSALRRTGVSRLLVVGGAGSLELAPGQRVLDEPWFPDFAKAEAAAGVIFLDALRMASDLDWTFLSPPLVFEPGERTGRYRTGGNTLLRDGDGKSAISMEDYAIAVLDELETPAHIRKRFTVAS